MSRRSAHLNFAEVNGAEVVHQISAADQEVAPVVDNQPEEVGVGVVACEAIHVVGTCNTNFHR
jgi:hypothetical protein